MSTGQACRANTFAHCTASPSILCHLFPFLLPWAVVSLRPSSSLQAHGAPHHRKVASSQRLAHNSYLPPGHPNIFRYSSVLTSDSFTPVCPACPGACSICTLLSLLISRSHDYHSPISRSQSAEMNFIPSLGTLPAFRSFPFHTSQPLIATLATVSLTLTSFPLSTQLAAQAVLSRYHTVCIIWSLRHSSWLSGCCPFCWSEKRGGSHWHKADLSLDPNATFGCWTLGKHVIPHEAHYLCTEYNLSDSQLY